MPRSALGSRREAPGGGLRLRRDPAQRGARVGRVGGLAGRLAPGAVRGDRRDRRGPAAPSPRARPLPARVRPAPRVRRARGSGLPRHEALYDVYPDAAAALARLRAAGVRVGFAGNQPAGAETALDDLVADGELVATSAAWGVAKPDPAFFMRITGELGLPAAEIAYIGDRVDLDVLPAAAAGMFTVHLRRGPWGTVQAAAPAAPRASAS